jgi:hypothetical protein
VNVAALASSAIQAAPMISVNAESSGHADPVQAGSFWLTENGRRCRIDSPHDRQQLDFPSLGLGTTLAILRGRVAEQEPAT